MNTVNEYSIADLKKEIAGKTKNQQLNIIKQAKVNYGLLLTSSLNFPPSIQYEHNFEGNIEKLLKTVEQDDSYKYDCDWNWFFNADNFPNQELVFATKDFLELRRKNEGDSLFIMNIVLRQMDELKQSLDKPIDYIAKLKSLPLDETQIYILFCLLLKWHGGFPVDNLNPKYNTLLKLIEREFLQKYPDQLTPEKEFCSSDIKTQKKMREAEAYIHAELKNKFSFVESRYIKKISIDFEDLPQYVVQRGIIWRFEEENLKTDSDYLQWRDKLAEFLQTIHQSLIIKTMQKGIEYGKKAYNFHLHNDCANPENCLLNQSWERRIAIAEGMLNEILKKQNGSEAHPTKKKKPKFIMSQLSI